MSTKIGRNDPCWCGSGKKYKKCHEAFDAKVEILRQKGYPVLDHKLIKTPEQIQKIKESCRINVAVLDYVAEHIKAGVSTEEIDHWVHEETVRHGGIPAPLNYEGFPKSVCTSVNEVVCHGIPSEDEILKDGDIVNVDVSTIYNGYFSDSSRMFCIGNVSPEKEKLVRRHGIADSILVDIHFDDRIAVRAKKCTPASVPPHSRIAHIAVSGPFLGKDCVHALVALLVHGVEAV